jgi:hypothetical protein
MIVLVYTLVISGLFLAAVSVPMILGRIPPNGLYGFRVRKTMEHPEIWYPVNKHAGQRLFIASLFLVFAAVGSAFIPGISVDVYSYAMLAFWLGTFSVAIVSTVRYMNSL